MDETDKKIEVNSTEEKIYTKEEVIAAIEQTQIPAESFSYTYEDTFMMEDLENRKLYINYQIDKNINELITKFAVKPLALAMGSVKLTRNKDYYSTCEVAKLLEVSESTVRRWANEGTLKYYKLPQTKYRRFDKETVDKLCANCKNISERQETGSDNKIYKKKFAIIDRSIPVCYNRCQ